MLVPLFETFSQLFFTTHKVGTSVTPKLDHLAAKFLNLLKHGMKSSMSIEWTNSRWTTRVSGTWTGSTSVSLYSLQSWCTRGKKCIFRRSKGKADKPSCYFSEDVLFVESLPWHEIFSDNISAENRANSLPYLIWSAARLAQRNKRRSAERQQQQQMLYLHDHKWITVLQKLLV